MHYWLDPGRGLAGTAVRTTHARQHFTSKSYFIDIWSTFRLKKDFGLIHWGRVEASCENVAHSIPGSVLVSEDGEGSEMCTALHLIRKPSVLIWFLFSVPDKVIDRARILQHFWSGFTFESRWLYSLYGLLSRPVVVLICWLVLHRVAVWMLPNRAIP